MKSTRDDITIDAAGPSPEENDESLNRQIQDLQRLIVARLQEGPKSTRGLAQSFSTTDRQKMIHSIGLRVDELEKQRQECLKTLSDNGWFWSPDTPIEQLQLFTDSLAEKAGCEKDAIGSFLRKRIDSIERELSESYPRRSQILHDAFEAHRAGKYTLSIPVFFSQADGIWQDRFDENFFAASKRRKRTLQDCKDDPQLRYVATMLTLLEPMKTGDNNPLWANKTERDSSFDALNRHQVLHGESVDYATEQNSFKAISLLGCFRGICRRVAQ